MDLEWNDFSKEAIIGNLSSVKGTEHDPYTC
ncbi:Tributyrin esterase [Staphylococcus aureus]|uniref:Tributyrin esterase n=1 Tax=Staphylococcus aureus TaxID=1280 RepID=A0A380DPE8_STAAU|nr:Tributyrin esterase [Staphylococcus aureus]